jgi:hypothetical protein
MLLALGRFGVRARIHFLSRAASPAIAPSPPPAAPTSVPKIPHAEPSFGIIAEPRI